MICEYFNCLLRPRDKLKIIPFSWCPSRFFSFHFNGWKAFDLSLENNELIQAVNVASSCIQSFYSIYGENFAFTDPILSIDKKGIITVKIGMMEMERYATMCKGNNQ